VPLKEFLHGGAPSKVTEMLEEIGTKENTETWKCNRKRGQIDGVRT
jgi:citrate synthase